MSIIKSEELKKMLKDKGLKLTTQREKVLEILQDNVSHHMTAEEIYNEVKKQSPEIGLATVYRTIQLFYDLKIVEKLHLDDSVRYELVKMDLEHQHHHLICEICGKVIEVEDDLLDQIEETCNEKYDFKVNNHILKFYGECSECKQTARK